MPLSCLLVAMGGGACNLDPYHLGFDGDAGTSVDGRGPLVDAGPVVHFDAGSGLGGDGGVLGGDGGAGCEPEICDGKDNDCDGVIDNGFDLQHDPSNCGHCGTLCNKAALNQSGSCVDGTCVYTCVSGFYDIDPDVAGCEYACTPSNGGIESCDGKDNNCDGTIDEGFNTSSDPLNCGQCGKACVVLHATPTCTAGVCGFGACEPGYADLRDDIPGCETRCPYNPPKATDTTCDGIDDDCNGKVDDGVPGVGDSCSTGLLGVCADGVFACVNGTPQCQPKAQPSPEQCNGKDDDCDGVIDNGYDKMNDPNHCGDSCTACAFPHAIAGCVNGQCKYAACDPGWVDLHPDDGTPANAGCDYQCTPTGPEICDGIDNDCDGLVDNADPDLIHPPSNFCNTRGACSTSTLVCGPPPTTCTGDTTITWRCSYGPDAETDSCGNLVAQETLCDGKDGDCDGKVDDAWANLGQACDDGKKGICRSTGTFQCTSDQTTTSCKITHTGSAPTAEVCNGLDDDCDGTVDDQASDNMVFIAKANSGLDHDYWIQAYEASMPDATSNSTGSVSTYTCARPGVLPWSLVTWTQATAVCAASNKRLCTEPEWQAACGGAAPTLYPYGATYQPNTCNGLDYDPDCTEPNANAALPSGTPMGCPTKPSTSACFKAFGSSKVYDMSGNVREWTSTSPGTVSSTDPTKLYRIRGGAYDNVGDALSCTFNFWAEVAASEYFNLGFRCCADSNTKVN